MGISLGLVGLGQFGSAFAPLFKAHPLVDRIALCDREPERIAKFGDDPKFQDKLDPSDAYEDLDAICASDLDALVIITQPWLHAPQAIQAMEAGKHVYSAVPIMCVPDGDEILYWCDKVIRTCERTGMRYMLGETTVFRPEGVYCRRRAAEGAFGPFVYAEGDYVHPFDSGCDLRRVQASRLASKSGQEWRERAQTYRDRGLKSGPMHYPTHSVSGPMNVMQAHAVKVSAMGMPPPEDEAFFRGSAFSNEVGLFRMSNGTLMRICEFRNVRDKARETFRLYGRDGGFANREWITGEGRPEVTELTNEDMCDALPEDVYAAFEEASVNSVYSGHGGSHAYLVHEFVTSVAEDRQPMIHAWEAARYVAAGVMAHKSCLRDGEVLDVPDWGDAPE